MARPRKDDADKRQREERYYANDAERDLVSRAAAALGKSKSDYAREAVVAAAVRDLLARQMEVPPGIAERYREPGQAAPADTRERQILNALDALKSAILEKKN